MKLQLIAKKQETTDAISFVFKPLDKFGWQAGQYLRYTLDHDKPDDRKTKRWFTISSAPHERNIVITTRFYNKRASTFKKALNNLPLGSEIEAEGPEGDFIVSDPNKYCVFIAGGIGITPFRSIILDLNQKNLPINATLLYANRNNEFVFKDELKKIAGYIKSFKIKYFIDPQKIDQKSILETVPSEAKPYFYISGPEPFVLAYVKILLAMGFLRDQIKKDDFPGYDWPMK